MLACPAAAVCHPESPDPRGVVWHCTLLRPPCDGSALALSEVGLSCALCGSPYHTALHKSNSFGVFLQPLFQLTSLRPGQEAMSKANSPFACQETSDQTVPSFSFGPDTFQQARSWVQAGTTRSPHTCTCSHKQVLTPLPPQCWRPAEK